MEIEAGLTRKVAAYQPDPAKLHAIQQAPLVLMVGITAAGKNAVLHRLMEKFPDQYYYMVSHTTRAPRVNHGELEREGVNYHFIDLSVVSKMLDDHEFIEAQVIHDSWISGSAVTEVERAVREHKIAVSDIDIKGAEVYVQLGLNVRPVFLLPPSYEIWKERFLTRYNGKVDARELSVRMQGAIREIEHALMLENFYIVINDDLEKTVDLVNEIAHGQPVEPHYHKAMQIAEQLLSRLREELAKLV
jgi:guanylate kinase